MIGDIDFAVVYVIQQKFKGAKWTDKEYHHDKEKAISEARRLAEIAQGSRSIRCITRSTIQKTLYECE